MSWARSLKYLRSGFPTKRNFLAFSWCQFLLLMVASYLSCPHSGTQGAPRVEENTEQGVMI